ncbi:SDR family NAD(P)-dependent oxidoreductase, partial [Escherichia coli]|uniref:SDR family NAD(P)-dependent oxidoreductase n=1 Tax=Escherichia coli TaxID=562 RepID=UPI001EF4A20A
EQGNVFLNGKRATIGDQVKPGDVVKVNGQLIEPREAENLVLINQKGVFLMSQAVARQMVKQHDGVIVNVSSESGLEGSEGQSC